MSEDLTAFLTARLDEQATRAEIARELREKLDDPYRVIDPGMRDGAEVTWRQVSADPARMAREVEAKRAILAEHWPGYPVTFPEPSGQPTCGVCHAGGWDWDPQNWPCPTVRHLAAIWSDHPDYRQEWAPAPATLAS